MKIRTLNVLPMAIALGLITSCNSQRSIVNSNKEKEMKAVQFRIARPTNKLREVVEFYQLGLGLEVLGEFEGHSGYDGVMLGLPDKTYHLEFTQYTEKVPLPKATKENLIVLYYDSIEEYKKANERIQKMGIAPVEPENPYWKDKSETYEDPDGWRIILFNGVYNP